MKGQPASAEIPVPPRPPVAIKGTREGLRIVVSPEHPDAVEASLRDQLARRAGSFFQDATVDLELPPGQMDLALVARLAPLVEASGMRLQRVSVRPADNRRAARATLPVPAGRAVPADAALVVHGTLRGGQRVVHDGSVVVLGDVNPGAEVLAGGSVVVWGRLRGKVEAGLDQGAEIVVCALDLTPTQLRIGPALARAPEEPNRVPVPEIAREVDGRIVVEAWR
jgi:septum site-determining protein MinC